MDPVISLLWGIMALLIGTQYAQVCTGLKWYTAIFVCVILFVCAPAFVIVQIAETMLDAILPEGWDEQ